MPTTNHPRGGKGAFGLELRPNQFNALTFDEVIDRQGQYVRWMKGRPCPVRTELSHHDLNCSVCHGRGALYEFQRYRGVYRESSPHGCRNPASGTPGLIKPFWNPVSRVFGVTLFRSPEEGGNYKCNVEGFNESEIMISPIDGIGYPESYDVLIVDYEVDYWEKKQQVFIGDGEKYDYKMDLEMPLQDTLVNSQSFHKSIAEIIYARYNDTGDEIPIRTFFDETVYFDTKPHKNKPFTIEAYIMAPILAVIHPLQIKVAEQLRWDMETGDLMGVTSATWEIGRGDVMTLLAVRQRMEELMTRSELLYDVLPYFDICEICSDIIDQNGKKYKRDIDFTLYDYNKILWTRNSPTAGVIYSVSFNERASYSVLNEKAEINANENKRLPKNLHLRRIERMMPGPIIPGLKQNDSPVGDWVKNFGGTA